MSAPDLLLSVSLSVRFGSNSPVLRDLSLQLQRGEILGLLGGSGCGKSTLALAVLGLLDRRRATLTGSVTYEGQELLSLKEKQMRRLRGKQISLVLQSPTAALNPVLRIGTQLSEAWRAHAERSEGAAEITQALERVSLPSDTAFLRRYPSEISVGQGQRVLIAMATLHSPTLLIADEPTSALDLVTQDEVLQLFQRINRDCGTSILLISHDLTAIRNSCDRVAILHEGAILQCGTWEDLASSSHPYVQSLVALATAGGRSKSICAGAV